VEDAGPVLDDGAVVGMLSTTDLIVQQSTLHLPTVITLLGATLEWPSSKKHFDKDVEKALGSTVGDVMNDDPVTCGPEDTVETAASLMHDQNLSRLPVVHDGVLVGLIARGDILRAIVEADG
jgi:CBS domain-containing protein